ncbi:MAG TPA: TIGR00725 family protein [bacterium (Candidatus Stahlbacteria)]|nr:TIGR00725 family protein [Candidatus Stahlbacteria bacterium]
MGERVNRKPHIGVVGARKCSEAIEKLAFDVGYEIAKRGAILICGGLTGVMEAACRGAKEANGITVGILPGEDKVDANPYVDIPIVTGMSVARNIIVVRSSDAIIAIAGKYGTLSEVAFALNVGVPVIGLSTWDIDVPIIKAKTADDAVNKAFATIRQ